MRVFGNIMNRLREGARAPTPEVGMGATQLGYSDRHAGTIVSVGKFGKTPTGRIGWKMDIATRTDGNGMSESQSYDYKENPEAETIYYTLRKDGTYVVEGESLKHGRRLQLGVRDKYHDFSH